MHPETSRQQASDLAALGEKILLELGSERSNDTLIRWLAHHIAELLMDAKKARTEGTVEEAKQAEDRCQAAILQLWKHRSSWPVGWPPPTAMKVSKYLGAVPDVEFDWHDGNLLAVLQEHHYQLLGALVDFATLSDDTSLERGWLERFGEELTNDEIGLLTRIVETDRRVSRLMNLAAEDNRARSENESGPRHPILILADRYRDAVYAVMERANEHASPEDAERSK